MVLPEVFIRTGVGNPSTKNQHWVFEDYWSVTYCWRRSLAKYKKKQQLWGDQQESNDDFSLYFSFDSREWALNSCSGASEWYCWQLHQRVANSPAKPTGASGMAVVPGLNLSNPCLPQKGNIFLSACMRYHMVRLILFLCQRSLTNNILYLVLMLYQLLFPKSHFHKSFCSLSPTSPP